MLPGFQPSITYEFEPVSAREKSLSNHYRKVIRIAFSEYALVIIQPNQSDSGLVTINQYLDAVSMIKLKPEPVCILY